MGAVEARVTDLSRARIAVTGGAGFLGSHIVEALHARGAREVVAIRSRDYNLVEPGAAVRMLADTGATIVIHGAATVGGIGANRENPGRFFYENLMMGAQLIEACRRAAVAKLCVIGTVCAYPKFTPVPFCEDELWAGYPEETNAPYGVAKKALLVQLQAYRQQYGLNGIYLLPANLYGPRDNFDEASSHVIPALIRRIDEVIGRGEGELSVWGDGTPTREFLHARDAARGVVLACERYDGAEPVNLGTGREVSIRELTEMLARLMGFHGTIRWRSEMPNGQPRRALDTSRARAWFGFEAEEELEAGLRETIGYWREQVAAARVLAEQQVQQ